MSPQNSRTQMYEPIDNRTDPIQSTSFMYICTISHIWNKWGPFCLYIDEWKIKTLNLNIVTSVFTVRLSPIQMSAPIPFYTPMYNIL